jgi:predicted nucleic acid-binding protein
MSYSTGSLVRARGREWVVLPDSTDDLLVLRPLGGAEEEAERSMAVLEELPIALVPPDSKQSHRAFAWTRRLNRAAAYEGFYLALAESLGCDLWTADWRLCNAVDLPWMRLSGAPS